MGDKFEEQIAAAQAEGDVGSLGQWLREERAKNARLTNERDRYRALLEEARRSYLKDGTIFAREVDAALEGKHEHQ